MYLKIDDKFRIKIIQPWPTAFRKPPNRHSRPPPPTLPFMYFRNRGITHYLSFILVFKCWIIKEFFYEFPEAVSFHVLCVYQTFLTESKRSD